MNLQTSKINNRVKRNSKSTKSRKKKNFSFVALFNLIVPIAVIFGMSTAMTMFNSETEKLNRKTSDLKVKIHDYERDIAELKILLEKYKGRFILRQVSNFKLKLRPAKPGQIRKLEVRKDPKLETLYVSQR